jgi:hypothetical protein
MRKEKPQKKQWSFWFTNLLLIIFGMIFILLSQILTNEFWKASCSNIASAIIVAGIFSVINEKISKDSLIELILAKMKLKQEIDSTGIEEVFTDISNVDYRYYLKTAKKSIDIVHVYGRTWTTNNMDEIEEKLLNTNCQIRVILLSPHSPFIDGLASYYNITPEDLVSKIEEVTDMWKCLYAKKMQRKKRSTQSSLTLYYHNGQPASALYRIDNRIINVQSKFSGGRSKKLPTLVCIDTERADDLYGNFYKEIQELIDISNEVSLE